MAIRPTEIHQPVWQSRKHDPDCGGKRQRWYGQDHHRDQLKRKLDLILCDGSPGIGCPVIASLMGASLALFVVEPVVSNLHDFRRVAELAMPLGVSGMLAVNKADLNAEATRQLEDLARQHGIAVVGRVPYDSAVTRAQVARQTVVEASNGPAALAIRTLWTEIHRRLQATTLAPVRVPVQLTLPAHADWTPCACEVVS